MSEFIAYCKEKLAIDELLEGGYAITSITEDLDGAKVIFSNPASTSERTELHLSNAEARKYVVGVLFHG